MLTSHLWNEPLPRPSDPISNRLKMPWLVHAGSSCPGCGGHVVELGRIGHVCGEQLEVVETGPALVLLIRYLAGYLVVRSDHWDRYLVEASEGIIIDNSSRIPLTTLHSIPWVIWDGFGRGRSTWPQASACPECGGSHSRTIANATFRCGCGARLLPLPYETITSFTTQLLVDKLWDEQAFIIKHAGLHLLFPVQTFLPDAPNLGGKPG